MLEEAGVQGEPVAELGETRYKYRLDGRLISKVVSFYLLRYVAGDPPSTTTRSRRLAG